jgi:tol-pal system protein YbgF
MLKVFTKIIFLVASFFTMALYAESAPVYDVDSLPSVNDVEPTKFKLNEATSSQEAYVPVQTEKPVVVQQITASQLASGSPKNLEQKIKQLEQQVSNLAENDLAARVESLQSQVQALQNQVEELTHQLQIAQDQQKTMYTDLDKRLNNRSTEDKASDPLLADSTPIKSTRKNAQKPIKKIVKPVVNESVSQTLSSDNQPNVAEEQQIYQTAYVLIKAKKYPEAIKSLQDILRKYPSGQFAANAHYWLGELYGLVGKNDQALQSFNTVLKEHPQSPRVSDAQLKVGLIYAAQSNWSEAKNAFKAVINHYPGTVSARLAAEQIKQIKLAGH